MNISFLKVFILIISLNVILSYNTIERTGDIFQVGVPLSALYMTYANNDNIGRHFFLKSFLTTFAATHVLKRVVARERPDGSNSLSFPSGHTSSAFSGASFIQKRYGFKFGVPAYCVASFVGYSRVHAKKHYWSDVIAGAFLAILNNYFFTKNLDIRVDAHIDPLNDNFYIKIYDNNCRFNYAKNL